MTNSNIVSMTSTNSGNSISRSIRPNNSRISSNASSTYSGNTVSSGSSSNSNNRRRTNRIERWYNGNSPYNTNTDRVYRYNTYSNNRGRSYNALGRSYNALGRRYNSYNDPRLFNSRRFNNERGYRSRNYNRPSRQIERVITRYNDPYSLRNYNSKTPITRTDKITFSKKLLITKQGDKKKKK